MKQNKIRPHYKNLTKIFTFKKNESLTDDQILQNYLFEEDLDLIDCKMSFNVATDTNTQLLELLGEEIIPEEPCEIEIFGTILGVYRTIKHTFYVVKSQEDDEQKINYIAVATNKEAILTTKELMVAELRQQINYFGRQNDGIMRFTAASMVCIMILVIILVRLANKPEPLILDFYDGKVETYDTPSQLYNDVSEAVVLINVYSASNDVDGSTATGMFITEDGYLISCAHIYSSVPNPKFMITLNDGTMQPAVLIAGDVESDVCLLKISRPDRKYKTVKFADSDNLQYGEECVILGFPGGFGIKPMLTQGVVSSTDLRKSNNAGYSNSFIQTDAAANPGNSGGGLFNMSGLCVGLVTSKYVDIHYDNTAYSVPSRTIKQVINDLYYKGNIMRPTLGITITALSPSDVEKGLPFGSKVVSVAETSGAYEKLKEGDIITKLNGEAVTPTNELLDILAKVSVDNLDIILEVFDVETMQYYTVEFKASIRLNSNGYITEHKTSPETPNP